MLTDALTISTGKPLPVLLNDRYKSFTGLITSDDYYGR